MGPITLFHVTSRFSNATALGPGFVYDKQGFWFSKNYSRSYQRTRNRMSSIKTVSVSNFLIRNIKTEKEDQNVITACRIMYENDIGCVCQF